MEAFPGQPRPARNDARTLFLDGARMIKRLLKPIVTRPAVAERISRTLLKLDSWTYKTLNDFLMYAGGGVHPKHRIMNYAQFFVDEVQPSDRVLDIGCGR